MMQLQNGGHYEMADDIEKSQVRTKYIVLVDLFCGPLCNATCLRN